MPEVREYEGGRIARPCVYENIFSEKVVLVPDPSMRESLPFMAIRGLEDLQSYLENGGKLHGLGAYLDEIGIDSMNAAISRSLGPGFHIAEGTRLFQQNQTGSILQITADHAFTSFRRVDDLARAHGLSHCELCSQWVSSENVLHRRANEWVFCRTCGPRTSNCAGCGNLDRTDNLRTCSGLTGRRCDECRSNYHHCESCDEYHDTRYCPNADLDEIQEHGFAPAIIKYGDQGASKFPFLIGMELELRTEEPVKTLRHIRAAHGDLFWGVYDGSVDGVELVSHPATIEYWQSLPLAIHPSAKNGNAGIHLHACRSGFNHSQLASMLSLFHSNHSFVKTVAERDSELEQWARISPPDEWEGVSNLPNFVGWDKYRAINFRHKHTLEFRIFNSSKKIPTILKNIEFIGSLWEWSKNGDTEGSPTLDNYLEYAKKSDFKNLKEFLTEKRLIVA